MYEVSDPCCCEPPDTPGRDPHQVYAYMSEEDRRCVHCGAFGDELTGSCVEV